MARDEVRVSLFPFMSVLACTIGALILLLSSLSLSAVVPRDASPRSPAPTGSAAAKRPGAQSGGPRHDEAEALAAVEALLARVDRALATEDGSELLPLEAIAERLSAKSQSRRLEADLARLEAERKKLEQDRETVEASVEVLESRRETLPILIDPTGLSRNLSPWFVECDAGGATAYRASDGTSVYLPREELSASLDYGRYLRRLRAMPGVLLVLLIRPDGLQTAGIAARVAEGAGVRVATLPLPGTGKLDWSLLQRAEANGPRAEAAP